MKEVLAAIILLTFMVVKNALLPYVPIITSPSLG